MKTLKLFLVASCCMAIAITAVAQQKTESFKVAGECGMCKKKIEKSAKEAGATYAAWNQTTKVLTVKYNSQSSNAAKIQQKIAGAGYDTPGFKASDEAYNSLDGCCQYDREAVKKDMSCCGPNCEMKDGKCTDESACKDKGCCKDSEACKAMGCCGHEKAAASKDGKSAMDCGAKACCKKS